MTFLLNLAGSTRIFFLYLQLRPILDIQATKLKRLKLFGNIGLPFSLMFIGLLMRTSWSALVRLLPF